MRIVDRGVQGAKWGFAFGIAYSLLAIALLLLGGDQLFVRNGITFERAIIIYLGGGTVVGVIVGVLGPIARKPIGAAVVGLIAGFPLGMIISATSSFRRDETPLSNVIFAIVFSCMIGVPGGLALRDVFRDNGRSGD